MAVRVAAPAPSTLRGVERTSTLSPPQVRQPYTPPPRTAEEDLEEGDVPLRQLQDSNEGNLDQHLDMKAHNAQGLEGMTICASPGDYAHPGRRKRRRESTAVTGATTLASMLRRATVDHQLGLSINLLALAGLSWFFFPRLRRSLEGFFLLSYKRTLPDGQTMYGQGPRDLSLVCAFIIAFTGLRAFMLEYVLTPTARALGVPSKRMRTRFAEQSYLLLYYLIFWNWGLYLFLRDTPSLSDGPSSSYSAMLTNLLISLYSGFPRLVLDGHMKIYYLSQLAFWIQQILVVHLEEKRKDHYQMLTHHFVTVALMSTSYGYREWRVGNAVLSAKLLKYLGLQTACDAAFGLFVIIWLFARHGCYLTICWSVYKFLGSDVMPYGTYSLTQTSSPTSNATHSISGVRLSSNADGSALSQVFQPFLNPSATTVSFNPRIRDTFLGLLLGLQGITLVWFTMIVAVVIRVLRGQAAEDTRSDDEGDVEDDEDEPIQNTKPVHPSKHSSIPIAEKPRFIEVEADSTEYVRRRPSSPRGRSRKGHTFSSGLNLGEHKDILNRIGCLSEEQLAREREAREKGER